MLAVAGALCSLATGCTDNADNRNDRRPGDEWDAGEPDPAPGEVNHGLGPFAERASDGRFCRIDYIERDLDGDGEIDQYSDAVYQEDGAVRVFEVDGGPDGDIDNLELTERDAAGRVVREQSANGHAQGGYRDLRRFEYNERGLLAREAYDENLDGTFDEELTFAYDDQGRRVRLNVVGSRSYIEFEYRDGGEEMVARTWDGDRLYSRNVTRWEFDQEGRKVRQEMYNWTRADDDGLGPIDSWTEWSYEGDHLVERRWAHEGGAVTSTVSRDYDNGLLETVVFDHVEAPPRVSWYTWECTDDEGPADAAAR